MEQGEKQILQGIFIAVSYFVALLILGAAWWKAAVISVMIVGALSVNMGTRWISRSGAALLVVALATWVDLLPAPSQMKAYATSQFETARAWQCSKQASVDPAR